MFRLTGDIPAKRRFRTGMIGGSQGAFFASYHRAAMRLSNRFQLVAGAFSSNLQTAREAGEALEIAPDRVYADYRELVEGERNRSDRVEVVVIATPNHLHFEPVKMLLEAGIAVICDKPLVNNLDEARELVRIAEKSGVFLAVTYTYLGYPMVRDARARIRAGELGEIRFMYVEYLLEWVAKGPSAIGKGGSWRADPAKAGPTGALGDVGTHAFNLLEFLSDKRCTALHAKLTSKAEGWPLDDTDVLQLEFEGGVDGLLWSSLAAPGHRNGLRFKIVGTKATAEWSQEAPETLKVSRLGRADLTYRRGHDDMTEDGRVAVNLPAGNPEAYLEALGALYADYAEALELGADWKSSGRPIAGVEEGFRGVALSTVSLESNRARAWVDFPAR